MSIGSNLIHGGYSGGCSVFTFAFQFTQFTNFINPNRSLSLHLLHYVVGHVVALSPDMFAIGFSAP